MIFLIIWDGSKGNLELFLNISLASNATSTSPPKKEFVVTLANTGFGKMIFESLIINPSRLIKHSEFAILSCKHDFAIL